MFEIKMTFAKAITDVSLELGLSYDLKPQQVEAVHSVVQRKDTFGLMPTGFGKSDIFVVATLVKQKVRPCRSSRNT